MNDDLELRAFLAREIFGLELWVETRGSNGEACVSHNPSGYPKKPWECTQKAYQQPERYRPGTIADLKKLGFWGTGFPRYESDPAAMMLLIERMRELGYLMDARCWDKDGSDHCRVYFEKRTYAPGSPVDGEAEADTLPRAVALAARAAVTQGANDAK